MEESPLATVNSSNFTMITFFAGMIVGGALMAAAVIWIIPNE